MTDQPSPIDDEDEEPVRWSAPQPSMDEYLVFLPECNAYVAPGEPSTFDVNEWMRDFERDMKDVERKPLITAQQLRDARALYDLNARRESLGGGRKDKRKPKSDRQGTLFGEDDPLETQSTSSSADVEELGDN